MDIPKNHISQLAGYIKKNLQKGYNQDTLRYSLISQGYSRISVDNAIDQAHKDLAKNIKPIKEKPSITYKIITKDETGQEKQKEILVSGLKKPWWKRVFL